MSSAEHQARSISPHRRLGEYLLAEGLLSATQLDEAVEYQCIYGGKLGTSLIELGLVTEDQLAKILSQQLKLHYIKPELLMDVTESLLSIIPKEVALKNKIVPYHRDGKKLYVAMNEVSNLANIDELSFQLDHIIIPLAIPEIRLMLALKQYYGMILSPRFETLASQMNRRMMAVQKKMSNMLPGEKTAAEAVEEPEDDAQFESNKPWPLLGDEDYAGKEPTDQNYFDSKASFTKVNSNDLLQQLANAKKRDDIACAIINYLKEDFPHCALLLVRDNMAAGWLATSNNRSHDFEQISIPIHENSIFNQIATSHSQYLGPVTDSLQNRKIIDFFDSQPPISALVTPLMVQDRLVSILYIQGQLEDLEQHSIEVQTIVNKAEMSFKLLILKNKIVAV